jgi:hypothetical protein
MRDEMHRAGRTIGGYQVSLFNGKEFNAHKTQRQACFCDFI